MQVQLKMHKVPATAIHSNKSRYIVELNTSTLLSLESCPPHPLPTPTPHPHPEIHESSITLTEIYCISRLATNFGMRYFWSRIWPYSDYWANDCRFYVNVFHIFPTSISRLEHFIFSAWYSRSFSLSHANSFQTSVVRAWCALPPIALERSPGISDATRHEGPSPGQQNLRAHEGLQRKTSAEQLAGKTGKLIE